MNRGKYPCSTCVARVGAVDTYGWHSVLSKKNLETPNAELGVTPLQDKASIANSHGCQACDTTCARTVKERVC